MRVVAVFDTRSTFGLAKFDTRNTVGVTELTDLDMLGQIFRMLNSHNRGI